MQTAIATYTKQVNAISNVVETLDIGSEST